MTFSDKDLKEVFLVYFKDYLKEDEVYVDLFMIVPDIYEYWVELGWISIKKTDGLFLTQGRVLKRGKLLLEFDQL